MVGGCSAALALYILCEYGSALIDSEAPEHSVPGMIIAAACMIVMSLLVRAKRRVDAGIRGGAMNADSKQADFCTYLSAIVLGRLLLNAIVGWWWADPQAGFVMVPIIAREGLDGLKGKPCCDG